MLEDIITQYTRSHATIDEKRKPFRASHQRYGKLWRKLRKPEELPDFDQPVDYEEEKKRFEPVQVEDMEERDSHEVFFQNVMSRNRIVFNGTSSFC